MFAALEAYHREHNDCRVPIDHEVRDRKVTAKLGTWVRRHRFHKPEDPERVRRLEALGFEFVTPAPRNADDEDDDRLLPAKIKGRLPLHSCMCSCPARCSRLMRRWARLKESKYVRCVRVPHSAATNTAVGRHKMAYRDAILRHLYPGGTFERTLASSRPGLKTTIDRCSTKDVKESVSMVHFHPDLIPHLQCEKDERKPALEKFQVPYALGERIGLEEEDQAPVPARDEEGRPSFFAVPSYDLDAATADVERAEAAYKEKAKRRAEENSATAEQMKADPTRYILEIHNQHEEIATLRQENKELRERIKTKNSKQFALEEKSERLLKGIEKMARRLDTLERSVVLAQAPIQSAQDLYRQATGRDLDKEGYYCVNAGGEREVSTPTGRPRKSWSDPRMERAVQAKWEDSSLSLEEALRAGGFDFPSLDQAEVPTKSILDADGVSVVRRKMLLCYALRRRKKAHARKTGDDSILAGKSPDPRMQRALAAMLADPTLSTEEGLRRGGFDFPSLEGEVIKNVVDSDGVSVAKRKHALLARLRNMKAKKGMPSQKQGRWYEARKGNKAGKISVSASEAEDVATSKEREGEESAEQSKADELAEESEEEIRSNILSQR